MQLTNSPIPVILTYNKEYTLTGSLVKSYAYGYASSGWKDRLTSFDGQTITYDAIGNPTTYRGHTLTWTNVRRLASYGSHTFSYGADGIRYKKDSTTYTLDGSTILKETNGTKTITYFYGVGGVVGFNYNGTNYYYQKNLQGDVTAIYNADGTCAATYTYDAWGKVLSVNNKTTANIGTLNPFRYRSYYYDTETGLYYLQTRYYDPETGRFINADGLNYLGEGKELSNYNLFAYCGNNPVMYVDFTGCVFWEIVAVIGTLILVSSIPSDNNQVPRYQQDAKQKYNSNTVNVYKNGEGNADPNKLNAQFYESGEYININIDGSLKINSKYEMNAVLDVIMQSEYYDEDLFGSREYMRAQWVAHNLNYKIASSGSLGFNLMKLMSGSDDPIESGSKLDIRSKNNMLKRQKLVYWLIDIFD